MHHKLAQSSAAFQPVHRKTTGATIGESYAALTVSPKSSQAAHFKMELKSQTSPRMTKTLKHQI
jgi:hypothetical protein